jgi:transcriptional regulator with XRE-family HTH domain
MPDQADPTSRAVGRRIAAARCAAGLTHAQLAQRLGWPRDTLIHYEHGRRAISVARLAAIAVALDLLPAALLIEDEAVATLFVRLADSPKLRTHVEFFLCTLAEEEP